MMHATGPGIRGGRDTPTGPGGDEFRFDRAVEDALVQADDEDEAGKVEEHERISGRFARAEPRAGAAAITAFDALAAPGQQDISPKSLYVAAFGELQAASRDLADAGVTRIVVFVDDLDRCLPANALDVLESMKL
jgi:hypothetical protein